MPSRALAVAHPLEQVETFAGPCHHDGVGVVGQPHLLETLRETAQRHVVDAERVQRLLGRGHLGSATVDDDEVGRIGEASWPTGLVAGSRKTVARMLTAERPAESRMGTASPKPDSAPEMAGPTRKPTPKLMPMIPKERVRSSGSVTSAM